MKKLSAVILSLAFVLALAGCAPTPEEQVPEDAPQQTQQPDTSPSEATSGETQYHLVTKMIANTMYAPTDEGFFEIIRSDPYGNDLHGTGNIAYIDCEAGTIEYLANNAGLIENAFGGYAPFVWDGKLYVAHSGVFALEEHIAEFGASASYLMQMNLDGTDKKVIELPLNIQIDPNGAVVADEQGSFYLQCHVSDANTGMSAEENIYRLDFFSMKYELAAELGIESFRKVYATYENGIVIVSEIIPEEFKDADRLTQMDNRKEVLDLLSLETGKVEKQIVLDEMFTFGKVVNECYMYSINYESENIEKRNLLTDETEIVCGLNEKLPEGFLPRDYMLSMNFYDNKLVMRGSDSDGHVRYLYYDLNTGELREYGMYYTNGLDTSLVQIHAENKDYFIVDIEGGEREGYCLIRKADYWDSNPNYILLKDRTLSSDNSQPV